MEATKHGHVLNAMRYKHVLRHKHVVEAQLYISVTEYTTVSRDRSDIRDACSCKVCGARSRKLSCVARGICGDRRPLYSL